MACKTCDHTMQGLGRVECGIRYFWCPRCGTLKAENDYASREYVEWESPRGWCRALHALREFDEAYTHIRSFEGPHQEAVKFLVDCDPQRKIPHAP